MSNAHQASDLAQMQALPLEAKERMSTERIKVWFESWTRFEIYDMATKKTRFATIETRSYQASPTLKGREYIVSEIKGQVYVSFSGGKDSTVLADLCAKFCQQYGYTLYLLFVNTGLEYPEIQKFVKVFAEWLRTTYEIEVVLDIVRPEMRFDEVIKKYGYPAISKEVSQQLYEIRKSAELHSIAPRATKPYNRKFNPESDYCKKHPSFCMQQWEFLIDADFNLSHMCCFVMKKIPSKKYEKETGRKPILGTLAQESRLRRTQWLIHGCNAFEKDRPTSQPLSFWTKQDILHYLKKYSIPYCSVYGDIVIDDATALEGQLNLIDALGDYEPEDRLKTTGCDRTGCIFCMFGCHLQKGANDFQRLKQTHPRQYEYCIGGGEMVDGKWQPSKEGLGLGKVLDYIGVKYD